MEGGKAGAGISGKMSHQQQHQHQQQKAGMGSEGRKQGDSDPLKCRSLVCDSTGIIIAEMVYRCMICNSVTDSITEARAHYQLNHMEEDEEPDEDYKFSSSNDSSRFHNSSPYNQQNQQQQQSSGGRPEHQSRQSSAFGRNPLVPDVSLYEGNSPLPLKFSNNHHNNSNNNNNNMHHNNNNHIMHNNNNNPSFKNHHSGPMDLQQVSHVPQGQMSATSTNGSNTKSGYVNCAVCGVTRFYSCVQRRYGQFTCVTCYRYFRTFLLKPKRYACPNLGQCPLNVRTRCRACWIKGCISVFSVDSRRQAVIEANLPLRRHNAGSAANGPVKSLLPPPPPLASFAAETNGGGDGSIKAEEEEEEEVEDGEQSASQSHDESEKESAYDAMLEPEVNLTEDADADDDDNLPDEDAVDGDEDEAEMDGSSLTEDQMSTEHPNAQQYQQRHQQLHQQQQQQQMHSAPPKLMSAIRPSLVNKLIVTGKKVWSCGKCMTCTAEDCGKCIYCLDRPKFGGPFIKKQRCIKRRCLMKIKNKTNTLLRK